jgi:hypothetical protein
MIETGEFIEPKRIKPDHAMKMIIADGISREDVRTWMQEHVNYLASKGCTFFQVDENDEQTVMLVSGWLQQPGLPDLPYVDRSELEMPKVHA